MCVHLSPPLVALPPVHFMQVHPDVYSCVVEGCPLETKERLSTMTSPVHVVNVTQWGAQLFMSCEFGTGMLCTGMGTVDVHAHVKIYAWGEGQLHQWAD